MTVIPDTQEVRKFLTLSYRQMVKANGRTTFPTMTAPMYSQVVAGDGLSALSAFQGFWSSLRQHLEGKGHHVVVKDTRPKVLPDPNLQQAILGLRPWQKGWILKALMTDNSGLIGGPTRFGKCLDPNTPVMMADGSIQKAHTIRDGDMVMGQDGNPRRVVGCIAGRDVMYRITPKKGEPFVVTRDHKLLLKRTNQGGRKSPGKDGEEILATPEEIVAASKTWRHLYKLVKRAVTFAAQPVPVDPYCYGLWLGDGHTGRPSLTTADPACARAWIREARRLGLRWSSIRKPGNKARTYALASRPMTGHHGMSRQDDSNALLRLQVRSSESGSKRIDRDFMVNSREVLLEVLAGYIDADGYVNGGKTYAIISKHLTLVQDVQFVARSLGFRATIYQKVSSAHAGHSATYHELHISGPVDEIPVRLERKKLKGLKNRCNPLTTGFSCEEIGEGDYYGFELEGPDRLFLLGDFTVTHNTYGMSGIARAFPDQTIVVVAPGVSLCKQLYEHFLEMFPRREVRGVYTGSKHRNQGPQGSITICSMDSLEKMDPDDTDILIIDEPHAVVSDERLPKLAAFSKTRKYGFGATLTGRFDKKDRLIEGLIGPVLSNVTYREAVAQGAISPLKVIMIKIPFSKDTIPGKRVERDVVYKRLLSQSSRVAKLVKQLADDVIPVDWQTMAFIQDEKQAEFYMEHAFPPHGTIAMAKRMTAKVRDSVTERIASGELVRVLASNIYVQGITFPDLKVVINLAGGGANTTAIQKPGRLLQARPGKNYGVMIDFIFECKDANQETRQPPPYQGIIGESWARHGAYVDIGYDVIFVEKLEQAVEIMKGAYEQ